MSFNIRTVPFEAKMHVFTHLGYDDIIATRQAVYNSSDQKTLSVCVQNTLTLTPEDRKAEFYANCLIGATRHGHTEIQAELLTNLSAKNYANCLIEATRHGYTGLQVELLSNFEYMNLSGEQINDLTLAAGSQKNIPLINLLFLHPRFTRHSLINFIVGIYSYQRADDLSESSWLAIYDKADALKIDEEEIRVAQFRGIYQALKNGRLQKDAIENIEPAILDIFQEKAITTKDLEALSSLVKIYMEKPENHLLRLALLYRLADRYNHVSIMNQIEQHANFNEGILRHLLSRALIFDKTSLAERLLAHPLMKVEFLKRELQVGGQSYSPTALIKILANPNMATFHPPIREYLENNIDILFKGLQRSSEDLRLKALSQFSAVHYLRLAAHEFKQSGYVTECLKGAAGAVIVISALSSLYAMI